MIAYSRRRRCRKSLLSVVSLAVVVGVSSAAQATTITVTGFTGGPGQNGGTADATARSGSITDADAMATATGGNGGNGTATTPNGGAGGTASAGAYIGTGGPALTDFPQVIVSATAIGGQGGYGDTAARGISGNGGYASLGTVSGGSSSLGAAVFVTGSVQGGDGGLAPSERLSNAVRGYSNGGSLALTQNATGGSALNPFGSGGYASSVLNENFAGASNAPSSLTLNVSSMGGNGGAANTFTTTTGQIQPIPGGRGGGTMSSAVGSLWGDGAVIINATAIGGNGGAADTVAVISAGPSGVAQLGQVSGQSGTGAVSVSGTAVGGNGGNGIDESLNNSVRGQTAGPLSLTQNATGGSALNPGGSGGYASSVLNENFAGTSNAPSSLTLNVSSMGGNGGAANTFTTTTGQIQPIPGGRGGGTMSSAVGSLSGDGAVIINATAVGGNGGAADTVAVISAGQGTIGQLGQVEGQSGSGAVSVSGTVIGGNGGNGVNESLNNAVRGQTAGPLSLTQNATGGSALNPYGSGGYASSVLNENLAGFSNTPSSLTLNVSSTGGNGAAAGLFASTTGQIQPIPGGKGGGTMSSAVGSLSGDRAVTINATAIGGNGGAADTAAGISGGQGTGGQLGQVSGQSGTGAVSISGTAIGGNGGNGANENLDNAVGGQTAGPLSLTQNATGGSALNPGGSGGFASSVLDQNLAGFSNAPSFLTLNVNSTGGNGGAAGTFTSTSGQIQLIPGGNGGGTMSSAVGSLSGDGAVTINATAIGGNGGAADIAAGISAGQGTDGQLAQVSGQSGTGAVSVSGTVIGGNGGNGVNESLENAVSGQTAGPLSLTQNGSGGSALNPGGSGGSGGSVLIENLVGANAPSSLTLNVSSTGGNGGAAGTNPSTGGQPQAVPGGNGGGTQSSAVGSLSGNGAVTINATAIGGNGGAADIAAGISAGQGAAGQLGRMSGESGTGAVSVSGTVIGGNGGDGANEVLDNVGGQTAGPLSLTENATGGSALNPGGSGGFANSVLNQNLAGLSNAPSSLTLNVSSTGGNGGTADAFTNTSGQTQTILGGKGGGPISSALGSLSGNGAVTISATAIGGNGGAGDTAAGISAGPSGVAQLGQVSGQSGTGAVGVLGTAIGGNGGNGANENLYNAVGGQTAGPLSLTLNATGGSALNPGGSGGFADSALNQNLSSLSSSPSSLTLNVSSTGGNGGAADAFETTSGQVESIPGGNGGGTMSSAVGSLSGNGAVTINATAVGGNGGAGEDAVGISGGQGGIAQLGQVSGLSGTGAVSVSGTAIGGNGAYGASESLNNLVTGTTTGSLYLTQTAQGGNGVNGGNAVSSLTPSASESSNLTLVSQAIGGVGAFPGPGLMVGRVPQSGTALADAGGMAEAGTATTIATARSSAGDFIQSVVTQAGAPLSSSVSRNVESFASIGQPMRISDVAGLQAVSYATGFTSLTAPTSDRAVELGSASLQAGGDSSPIAYTASATWDFNPVKLWVPGQSMIVTFSNVGYTGSGLVSFKILLNNELVGGVGDQGTSVNFAMAQNYFTHSPIDLGTLDAMPQNSTLELLLSVVSTAGGVFDPTVNLYNGPSSSVPEPGALAILLLGTLPMVLRRRRKASQ